MAGRRLRSVLPVIMAAGLSISAIVASPVAGGALASSDGAAQVAAPVAAGSPESGAAPSAFAAAQAVDPLTMQASGPSYVTPGSEIAYEMTLENQTTSSITDIGVFVQVPANTTYVSGGNFIPGDNGSEFYVNSLAPKTKQTLTFVVGTASNIAIGTLIENDTFEVYASTVGGNPGPTFFAFPGVVTTIEAAGTVVAVHRNKAGRAFDVTVDGYGFQNFGADAPRVAADDLKAADLFELFGPGVCKSGKTAAKCVLSGPAQKWLDSQLAGMTGGHCDGMAATSLRVFDDLAYRGSTKVSTFEQGAVVINDVGFPNEKIENYIAHYFVTQIFDEVWDTHVEGTPVELLNHLIAEFSKPNSVPYTVAIFKMPGYKAGHAIVAYGVERVSDTESRILVYDNNYPNQRQYITVDTAKNTFRYVTAAVPGQPPDVYEGAATGKLSGGLWLVPNRARDLPAGKYFSCPFCSTGTGGAGAQAAAQQGTTNAAVHADAAATGAIAGRFQIQYSGEGAFIVVDDEGRSVGSDPVTQEFLNEIPGTRISPVPGGLGLDLPPILVVPFDEHDDARYRVVVHGQATDSTTAGSLTITGDGYAIGVNHIGLDPGEVFEFTFSPDGDHMSFTSSETIEAPEIFVSHDPLHAGDPSVIFDVSGVTVHAGETISLDLDPELERIHFDDTGAEDELFEIDMRLILPNGDVDDFAESIHLPAGSKSAFVDFGAWDHLLHPPIYIDGVLQNPSVNHRLRLDQVTGSYDSTPAPDAPSGTYRAAATFTNVTEVSLTDVTLDVVELGEGHVVLNADGGPAGVGSVVSVPPDALGPDGILHSDESFTIMLDVGLLSDTRATLVVDANGVPHDWIHPSRPLSYDANNASYVLAVGTGPFCNGRLATIVGVGRETIFGTDDDDVIVGSDLRQIIHGGLGDDTICANSGRDVVYGEEGADWISGGSGNDRIVGGPGDDVLIGNRGNDALYGGGNDDLLNALGGSDTVLGGSGNDQAIARDGQPDIIDLQAGGADRAQYDLGGLDTVSGVEIVD